MSEIVTAIDAVKDRLQPQQRVVQTEQTASVTWSRGELMSLRAELDALWEAVAVLAQVAEGVPVQSVRVHDYFAEGGHLSRE